MEAEVAEQARRRLRTSAAPSASPRRNRDYQAAQALGLLRARQHRAANPEAAARAAGLPGTCSKPLALALVRGQPPCSRWSSRRYRSRASRPAASTSARAGSKPRLRGHAPRARSRGSARSSTASSRRFLERPLERRLRTATSGSTRSPAARTRARAAIAQVERRRRHRRQRRPVKLRSVDSGIRDGRNNSPERVSGCVHGSHFSAGWWRGAMSAAFVRNSSTSDAHQEGSRRGDRDRLRRAPRGSARPLDCSWSMRNLLTRRARRAAEDAGGDDRCA